MNFFQDGVANGYLPHKKSILLEIINDLIGKIEDELERKEELLFQLEQIDIRIEELREDLSDMRGEMR